MKLLLCVRCNPYAAQVLETGQQLARALAAEVEILVVAASREDPVCAWAETTRAALDEAGLTVQLRFEDGKWDQAVLRRSQLAAYDLVIIGSRGRRGILNTLFGSPARHIAEAASIPVLVLKGRPRAFKKLLICSSAGPVSERTVDFAGRLAKLLGAEITLLHVMSQLSIGERSREDDLTASAAELMSRESMEGQHLRTMLAHLESETVIARALVRHGLVVDEVIAEAKSGRYDLIAVGAHITPGLPAFLVDDLAAKILHATSLPILVVH